MSIVTLYNGARHPARCIVNIHRICGTMVPSRKMTPWLMAFICLATAGCSNVTDQQTSESQHDQQVAILKQIRKVNEDGSYSFGYEAGDGSFKVESRDVLGNIKGTFGFVDANGEIKRVSYSSSNGTGFQSSTVTPLQEQISVVQSIPRINRTSTTRKPNVIYTSSTETASKSSVVQSIARSRKPGSATTSSTTSTTESTHKPTFIRSKGRHRYVLAGQQRPIIIDGDVEVEDSQINRPNVNDRDNTRKITFPKRPVDHGLRPITEEFVDKDDDIPITTGNSLRRQLQEETTKSTPAPVVDPEDDHSDVYSGSLSTSRPLFTTTAPPRVIQRILSRAEQQKRIYSNQENRGPAKFSQKYESPSMFEAEAKVQEDHTPLQQILVRASPRTSTDSRDYVRQGTEPIYVRQHPDPYLRDLSTNGILVQTAPNSPDEDQNYRAIPVGRLLFRPVSTQQSLYTTTTDANVQYIAETPITEQEDTVRVPLNPTYVPRQRPYARQPLLYADQDIRARPVMRPVVVHPVAPHPDDREYPVMMQEQPYRMKQIALPPEPPNPIPPPLSRRDFQLLLRRLLFSQYGAEALNYPKRYLEDALYDQQPYASYQSTYRAPVPRQDVVYEPSELNYGDRMASRRPVFTRALSSAYQGNQYEEYPETRYPKRFYRQKVYTPEYTEDGEEILPPPIREALLLRMLQLAINSERSMPTEPLMAINPANRYKKSGPVRSVQILGEDIDDEKNIMRKKLV